ncbi:MAG: epoxyqueuosine reductase [Deferrisomatales bacterium]
MAAALGAEIGRLVEESRGNQREDGGRYFDSPLLGVAGADDPLFGTYKEVIGPFHWTPREVFEAAFGPWSLAAGSVVSWALPIDLGTRRSNRAEARLPSRLWAHTRDFGERFNDEVRRAVVERLVGLGYRAVAPMHRPEWRRVDDPRVGIASTWSERHAAYAAGLGTFSLNDGLITERGIAHRLGSVVTDAVLPPTPRRAAHYRQNCAFFAPVGCGVCIGRCPAGAITEAGHDKERCRHWSYDVALGALGAEYGVGVTGCGLCQTGVPCESRVPAGAGVGKDEG